MTCTAKTSAGRPCRCPAIRGGNVCRTHGGSAPQVKEAARLRLLSLVDPAIGVLARATRRRVGKAAEKWEPSQTEIAAAKEILARAGVGEADRMDVSVEVSVAETLRAKRQARLGQGPKEITE